MPKIQLWTMLLAAGAALALPLAAPAGSFQLNEQSAKSTVHANAGAATTSAHSTQAMPAGLRPALYGALAKDAGPAYDIDKKGCATLPKQKLTACFDRGGAHFTGADTPLALHLVGRGRLPAGKSGSSGLTPIKAVEPAIKGNQASYVHGDLTAWWRALPMGFEQGFTIAKRPGGKGELTLVLAADNRSSQHNGTVSWGKLRYGDLAVTDAAGKVIPASLKSEGNRILIVVNDAHAAYPLTVDPLVWIEQKVTSSDGAPGDWFGNAVAVSGRIALVGAPNATVNGHGYQGAVYVFAESGGTWVQTAKLTASDGAAGDEFGSSVALDGMTAVVGAFGATVNGNGGAGAAYVFGNSGGSWTQTTKLTASDAGFHAWLGRSVAVSGTTAFVGAPLANIGIHEGQGAAYVFSQSGGTWAQTQKLAPSGSEGFGSSVALNGTTALVGTSHVGVGGAAAYLFTESGGSWTQTQELTPIGGFFGVSVALDGPIALLGAPLANAGGNSGQGAVYVFEKSGGAWTQAAQLTASDGTEGDHFGVSVALYDTTAIVGARFATINGNSEQGAAYVFSESSGSWDQSQKLRARDGASGDEFGTSVALDGRTALLGASLADVGGNYDQGAAYFYGQSDLGLAVSAPQTVGQGQQYVSQTIATNNASAASAAVMATITVPEAASFVSAMASQGSCREDSGVVTCDFGPISGNAGTATANVTLKATGNVGDAIDNTASIVHATPPLTASAPTVITEGGACPEGYTEYDGTLAPGQRAWSPRYRAPGGEENAILTAPEGFHLFMVLRRAGNGWKLYRIPSNEVHHWGPGGTYRWVVRATPRSAGGAYTLCVMHP